MKYLIIILIASSIFFSACDFTKVIDVPIEDFPTRLSVSAVLDSDSLVLSISESHSIAAYSDWQPTDVSIIRNGTIELLEEGKSIYFVSESFDLSMRSDSVDGYHAIHKGFSPTSPGLNYQLKVNIEGYDPVVSSAAMPQNIMVNHVQIDTAVSEINQIILDGWSLSDDSSWERYTPYSKYYLIDLNLTDIPDETSYYSFQLLFQSTAIEVNGGTPEDKAKILSLFRTHTRPFIYTDNMNLVRDSPDFEMRLQELNEKAPSFFGTDFLVASDASFANETVNLKFYVDTSSVYHKIFFYYNHYPCFIKNKRNADFIPSEENIEIRLRSRLSIAVKHFGYETFQHYRSMSLQQQGVGFFKEPISIYSNIQNGLGCFSLCSSYYHELLDIEPFIYIQMPE